ncbi:uncharacterized protein LOC112350020 [Selaginella moellendorffii]|uniref:uncharacterized protein LOC112350020 n=1 Tax=Selaginella moellendorffii TaxID=88036 RepID=UPI000D1C7B3D|nr:uncharacterized protein LOC112350020 [Selaginella moellendorffii]|eukprot:XP_024541229.1 uncharacterized protein LOC112350020 [Selaginella moellendorffii]
MPRCSRDSSGRRLGAGIPVKPPLAPKKPLDDWVFVYGHPKRLIFLVLCSLPFFFLVSLFLWFHFCFCFSLSFSFFGDAYRTNAMILYRRSSWKAKTLRLLGWWSIFCTACNAKSPLSRGLEELETRRSSGGL